MLKNMGPMVPQYIYRRYEGYFFFPASNAITGLKRGVIIGLDVHIIFSKEKKGHLIRMRASGNTSRPVQA